MKIDGINVYKVAPFMGAWIEITATLTKAATSTVAPFMGAWIEIVKSLEFGCLLHSRTLHGCVD